MSQIATKLRLPRIGFLQIGIILLAVITAVMHLYLGITMGSMMAGSPPAGASSGGFSIMALLPLPLPILFDLNFAGYMVLVTAHYLPALQRFQRLTRWLLIGYTAITILLWYLIAGSHPDMVEYINKSVEVVLIAFLLIEGWLTRHQSA